MRWEGPQPHLFGCCPITAFLPVWSDCVNVRWNRCQGDLNSFLLRELEETTRYPCTTWMKTIQQDLKCNNLSMDEAIDVAQNHPLWRLMSLLRWRRAELWCWVERNVWLWQILPATGPGVCCEDRPGIPDGSPGTVHIRRGDRWPEDSGVPEGPQNCWPVTDGWHHSVSDCRSPKLLRPSSLLTDQGDTVGDFNFWLSLSLSLSLS